jgi:hypothetical protein
LWVSQIGMDKLGESEEVVDSLQWFSNILSNGIFVLDRNSHRSTYKKVKCRPSLGKVGEKISVGPAFFFPASTRRFLNRPSTCFLKFACYQTLLGTLVKNTDSLVLPMVRKENMTRSWWQDNDVCQRKCL